MLCAPRGSYWAALLAAWLPACGLDWPTPVDPTPLCSATGIDQLDDQGCVFNRSQSTHPWALLRDGDLLYWSSFGESEVGALHVISTSLDPQSHKERLFDRGDTQGFHPRGIHLTDRWLYFTTGGGRKLCRADKDPGDAPFFGQPQCIDAHGQSFGVVTCGDWLVWSVDDQTGKDDGQIFAILEENFPANPPPRALTEIITKAAHVACDPTGSRVAWTSKPGTRTHMMGWVGLEDSTDVGFADGPSEPIDGGSIEATAAADVLWIGDEIFWRAAATDFKASRGWLLRTRPASGETQPLVTIPSDDTPRLLVADASGLFWTNGNKGEIVALPAGSESAKTVFAYHSADFVPHGIASDSKFLYWVEYKANRLVKLRKP